MSLPDRPQAHPFVFGLTGVAILGASIWIFLLILESVYGRYDTADLLPTMKRLRAALGSKRVAVVMSRYSEQVLPEGSLWLRDNINAWDHLLASSDLSYDLLDDQAVETGRLADYGLVVLPGGRAVSDREIVEIKKYLEHGGSVFATGGTASLTEKGEWRGWDFLSQVYGLQFTEEISPEQATRQLTLRGGLPVTAGIPTGYTLSVATWDKPIACRVLEPRTTQASTWYSSLSEGGLAREAIEKTAGTAFGTYGRGRFLWLGFELNAVLGDRNDYVFFETLCRRSLDWLAYTPTILIHDWPSTYKAAAMIAVSVSNEPANAVRLIGSFQGEKVPLTFFVDPDTSTVSRSLASALASGGDLGTMISTVSSTGLQGGASIQVSPRKTESDHLTRLREHIGELGGFAVAGAYIPSGSIEEPEVSSLRQAGYRYLVGDFISDRSVPGIAVRDGLPLVTIARTARGDEDIISRFGLADTALQLYTYNEDADRVLFQGGLYTVRLHSDLQCRPEYVRVVKNLAHYVRSNGFWLATGSDIARWWVSRNALEVSARVRSNRRIALVMTNPSNLASENAVVQLNINKAVSNVTLTSDILGTTVPPYRYNPATQVLEITIPFLGGGKSLSLFVDYDNVSV
jgi:hypothetical protein